MSVGASWSIFKLRVNQLFNHYVLLQLQHHLETSELWQPYGTEMLICSQRHCSLLFTCQSVKTSLRALKEALDRVLYCAWWEADWNRPHVCHWHLRCKALSADLCCSKTQYRHTDDIWVRSYNIVHGIYRQFVRNYSNLEQNLTLAVGHWTWGGSCQSDLI